METTETIVVRSYELDWQKHVNHAVYLNYMEHARARLLEKLRREFLEESRAFGHGMVMTESHVKYRSSALLDEELSIHTRIEVRGVRIRFLQTIRRKNDDSLVAEGVNTAVILNASGKPMRPPTTFTKTLGR